MVVYWKKEWELGNELVDTQHKKLISIINKASEKRVSIQDIVEELIEYAARHFADEEALMQKLGYEEGLEEHRREHNLFRESLLDMSFDLIKAKDILEINTKALLLEKFCFLWFNNHFLETDKKFIDFINGGGANNKYEK